MSSAELRLTLLVHRQRRWSAREAMNEAGCPSEASFAKFAAILRRASSLVNSLADDLRPISSS